MLENCRDIAGDEELFFTESDDDGRAQPGGDDFQGIAVRERATSAKAPVMSFTDLRTASSSDVARRIF